MVPVIWRLITYKGLRRYRTEDNKTRTLTVFIYGKGEGQKPLGVRL